MNPRWSWSKETEWTDAGNRLFGEATDGDGAGGVLFLTCQSQVIVIVDGAPRRQQWNLSRLCIPLVNPRCHVERLTAHRLAFFGDPVLCQAGMAFCREAYESAKLVELAPSFGGASIAMN